MSQLKQSPRHLVRGGTVVDPHADRLGRLIGPHSRPDAPRCTQHPQHFGRFAQRRREQHAADPRAGHLLQRSGRRRASALPLEQAEPRAPRRRLLEHAGQEFAHESAAGVGIDDADPQFGGGDEAARRDIGRIGQVPDRFLDRNARGGTDPRASVNDARNGHRRYARARRHVDDGRVSPRPVGSCHLLYVLPPPPVSLRPRRSHARRKAESGHGIRLRRPDTCLDN